MADNVQFSRVEGSLARTQYDIYVSSYPATSNFQNVSLSGITGIYLINQTSYTQYLTKIEFRVLDGNTSKLIAVFNYNDLALQRDSAEQRVALSDASEATYYSPTMTTSGKKDIRVSCFYKYGGMVTSVTNLTIQVFDIALRSISINSTSVKKNFLKNENFTTDGLVVTGYYVYTISGGGIGNIAINNYECNIPVGQPLTEVGLSQDVIISRLNFSSSYKINVYGATLSFVGSPTKYNFFVNDPLSGYPTQAKIHYGGDYEDETVDIDISNYQYNFNHENQQSQVTAVVYDENTGENLSVSYYVNVTFNPSYIVDETTISTNIPSSFNLQLLVDKVNLSGKVVTYAKTDGTIVSGTINSSNILVTNDGVSHILKSDNNSLSLPPTERTSFADNVYFEIQNQRVNLKTITVNVIYNSRIALDLSSVKTQYYLGNELDLSNLVVALYQMTTPNTETFVKNLTSSEYTVSEVEQPFEEIGEQTITISYGDLSASFTINVSNKELVELSSTGQPVLDYIEEAQFDIGNLKIYGVYNDEEADPIEITNYDLYIGNSMVDAIKIADGEVVSSLYGGFTSPKLFAVYGELELELGDFEFTEKTATSISFSGGTPDFIFERGTPINFGTYEVHINFNSGNPLILNKLDVKYSLNINGTVKEITEGYVFGVDDTISGNVKVEYTFREQTALVNQTVSTTLTDPSIVGLRFEITNQNRDLVVGNTWNISTVLAVYPIYENGLETNTALSGWTHSSMNFIGTSNVVVLPTGETYGNRTITITYNAGLKTVTEDLVVSLLPNASVTSFYMSPLSDYIYRVGTNLRPELFNGKATFDQIVGEFTVYGFSIDTSLLTSQGNKTITGTYKNTNGSTIISIAGAVGTVSIVTNLYKVALGDSDGTVYRQIVRDGQTISLGLTFDNGKIVGGNLLVFKSANVGVDTNNLHETYGYNVYTGDDYEADAIGYMSFGVSGSENGHLVLFVDPANPIVADNNITAKFPHYVSGYADRINLCNFGIIYNKRLFISGNKEYKNFDWHSEPINLSTINDADYNLEDTEDFTYFSDLNYCKYGSEDTAIVGYSIYRDGDLIVVKEGSKTQATLYRRSPSLNTAIDYTGNTLDGNYETNFPMFDINQYGGEGGVSNRTVVNFTGESLVLTRSGIKAITNKENIYSNAKYSADVSTYINTVLKDKDLYKAFMYSYKDQLLLNIGGETYVGYYSLRNEGNEYEWYLLEGFSPSTFFEVNGELYFGTNEGKISRFDDTYIDKDRLYIIEGGAGLSLDATNKRIVVNSKYIDKVREGDTFHLIADNNYEIHANIGWFKPTSDTSTDAKYVGDFFYDNTEGCWLLKINLSGTDYRQYDFYDGREVYIDKCNKANVGKSLKLKKVTREQSQVDFFKLVDDFDEPIDLSQDDEIRVSIRVNSDVKTSVYDIDVATNSFALKNGRGNVMDLIAYDDITGVYYSGVLSKETNVDALYMTRPYDFGTIAYSKNVWSWFVTNDTNLRSEMTIKFLPSRFDKFKTSIQSIKAPDEIQKDIANGTLNFEKFHFVSNENMPETFTKHRAVPNLNYVRFLFENDKDTNIVLTKLSIVYTFGLINKGVK